MDIATRCLPVGALPYSDIKHATAMISKLYSKAPFVASLPFVSKTDTVADWLFEGIPGVSYEDGKLKLQIGSSDYEENISRLDRVFNSPNSEELESFAFHAKFFEKYLQIIKKFHSPNAYVNLLGPFTIFQLLIEVAKTQILADKSYRKLFIQAVCVKALWAIKKIKEMNPDTVPIRK